MVASMPVAKLSREFYDRFGDKVTDELVNCLNSIEASYRAEIKDLFAAHFERFEEKLERHTAETTAQVARFEEKLERHTAETAAHFGRFEERFERRLAETATDFARFEANTATHFARFEEKFEHRLAATQAELRVEIHSVKADLIKWTFVFWAPVALAVIGLYFKT